MTDHTTRDLITRMADELDHYRQLLTDDRSERHPLAAEARAALATEPPGEEPPTVMQIIELAEEIEAAELGQVDLVRAALARWGRSTPPAAEALAARPLLEQVARMGDRIGQHTVGEIMVLSDRAHDWLDAFDRSRHAALSQPEPEEPTDEELWRVGDEDFRANTWPTDAIRYARAILARFGRPAHALPAPTTTSENV